jgi:hypothetical protein
LWVSKQLVKDFFGDFQTMKDIYKEFYYAHVKGDVKKMEELAGRYDLPAIRGIYYKKVH